jgi:hypothetical protein
MGTPFDQLAKKVGTRALRRYGHTVAQHEISSNAQQADLRHDPDPASHAERTRIGLLGRMTSTVCLIENFSSAPGEDQVLACVTKFLAFRQALRRETEKAKPERRPVKPFLWIITAGRPTSALALLGARRAKGWPPGVYVSPGEPADTSETDEPDPGGMLRVGIVVASELPRDRSTILVRIMAGGAALPAALADVLALPADAYEREVASLEDVVELRRALGSKPNRTAEEEEFIVSTQSAAEELRNEGRREGLQEAAARDLLTVLRARGVAVPDVIRERILAEKDPSLLERWIERAAVATSIVQVIDEPS